MHKKLYQIITGLPSSNKCWCSYVIADDPTAAWEKVKDYIEKKDIGFSIDRRLKSIEVIAEDCDFTSYDSKLFL